MLEIGAAPLVRAARRSMHLTSHLTPFDAAFGDGPLLMARGSGAGGLDMGRAPDPLWRWRLRTALRHDRRVVAAVQRLAPSDRRRSAASTRNASHEFDLDLAADDERAFAALWSLARAEMFVGGGGSPLPWSWTAPERYASRVCRSLREGVLAASTEVLTALMMRRGRRDVPAIGVAFEQSLTIVYRMLFLLFAEARGSGPAVASGLSRELQHRGAACAAEQSAAARSGLWDALRAIARLAHGGCRAGDLRVTPFNGRLFAPARTPLAERRDLDDEAARQAIVALSTRPAARSATDASASPTAISASSNSARSTKRCSISSRDVEPATEAQASGEAITLARGSVLERQPARFYTPQPIADYLVRRDARTARVGDASPDRILQLRIVDPAMGSGAFLVAACRYLASAYESALIASGGCHPSGLRRAGARRHPPDDRGAVSVRRGPEPDGRSTRDACRYGSRRSRPIVRSPFSTIGSSGRRQSARRLARSSLRCPPRSVEARRRSRRAPAVSPTLPHQAALRRRLPVRFSSRDDSRRHASNTCARRSRALAGLTARDSALSRWKRVADVWCAVWFASRDRRGRRGAHLPTCRDAILSSAGTLPARTAATYLDAAERIAARHRFFHWELEFPEVFFDAKGVRDRTAASTR